MNLPATAISFLDAFIGLYKGKESLFEPHSETKRPMVHVYCFEVNHREGKAERAICQRISEALGCTIALDGEDVHLEAVRDVAPLKQMWCASFRIPAEVLFG